MDNEMLVLRELAGRYAEIANDPVNQKRIILHRAVNDKVLMRPVVLLDELPWHELDVDGQLRTVCTDADYLEAEIFFRRELYKWKYIQADMVVRPFYAVKKVIETTGIGIGIVENTLETRPGVDTAIKSHHYVNQIETDEDIDRLHNQVLTYNEKLTRQRYQKISAVIGDILPVKITGVETGYDNACKNWDDIAMYMGPEAVLTGLIEEPEMMHKLVGKLTDIFLDTVRQYEDLDLYEPNQITMHGVSALNSELCINIDYNHVKAKNMWGRGIAQFFSTVSKQMREEYDISYMKRAMKPFGLVYYGCCEPLHNMIDIVGEIPNIRKIGVTPWADVDIAADNMGDRYVMAFKPHPVFTTDFLLYKDSIVNEIQRMLNAVRRNHTACDIALKDVSTVNGDPYNLFRWTELVMSMVERFEY